MAAYCTVAELAQALGRRVTSEEQDRMQLCVDAAAEEMDQYMARSTEVPAGDPLANRVNVLRAVEWFKSQDSIAGGVGFAETGVLQVPRVSFASRHGGSLIPLKEAWGVA